MGVVSQTEWEEMGTVSVRDRPKGNGDCVSVRQTKREWGLCQCETDQKGMGIVSVRDRPKGNGDCLSERQTKREWGLCQ